MKGTRVFFTSGVSAFAGDAVSEGIVSRSMEKRIGRIKVNLDSAATEQEP